MTAGDKLLGWGLGMVAAVLLFLVCYGLWSINQPVKPCAEMVAMSRTCIPFGCTHTYVNARGEDTGECG